jgi:hypothetical protein
MKKTFKILLGLAALALIVFLILKSFRADYKIVESIAPQIQEDPKKAKPGENTDAPAADTSATFQLPLAAKVGVVPLSSIPAAPMPPKPEQLYPGEILVYAKQKMTEHEDELIVAVVGIKLDKDRVVTDISRSLGADEHEVSSSTKVHGATLSDSLRISLEFNPADFKLVDGSKSYYLHFDKAQQPFFTWEVEPLSPGPKKLTVKLENYINHSWTRFALPQIIEIDVKVNTKTFFVRIWDKLQNDPSWSLNNILLPILAFVGGLFATAIRKKLKGKKKGK